MALGTEHIQATQLHDFVVLCGHRMLGLCHGIRPSCLVLLRCLLGIEPARLQRGNGAMLGVATEHDVRTTAGHVGGHGDGTLAARLGHNRGLSLVLLRIEDFMANACLAQHPRKLLRLLHGGGSDQHRLTSLVTLGDVVDNRPQLSRARRVDAINLIHTDHRLVRGNRHNAQIVGGGELLGLGLCGTGHTRQLVVEAEVVL